MEVNACQKSRDIAVIGWNNTLFPHHHITQDRDIPSVTFRSVWIEMTLKFARVMVNWHPERFQSQIDWVGSPPTRHNTHEISRWNSALVYLLPQQSVIPARCENTNVSSTELTTLGFSCAHARVTLPIKTALNKNLVSVKSWTVPFLTITCYFFSQGRTTEIRKLASK